MCVREGVCDRENVCDYYSHQFGGPGLLPTRTPRKALRGGIQNSILTKISGNVGDSPQMLTKTSQWLQERASDTPTKGPLWLEQELHHQTQDIN